MKLSIYDGKEIDLDNLAYLVSALIDPGKTVTDNRVVYSKDDIIDFLSDLEDKVVALEQDLEHYEYLMSKEADEEFEGMQGRY